MKNVSNLLSFIIFLPSLDPTLSSPTELRRTQSGNAEYSRLNSAFKRKFSGHKLKKFSCLLSFLSKRKLSNFLRK